MNVRIIILAILCTSHLKAMMQEDVLPISGNNVAPNELPAALFILLNNGCSEFKEQPITYEMDVAQSILVMHGSEPVVKLFSHDNGVFKELQKLEQSTSPAVHSLGTALAVLKTENNGPSRALDYYVRVGPFFTHDTTLTFKEEVTGVVFNNDGSRLCVNLLASNGKSETKEYEKGEGGGLEATGLMESMKRRLSFGREK